MAPTILIVDDEPQIRRVLRVTLESHGYQTREAESGAEGLEAALSLEPQLILLDIGLPDMAGTQVLEAIRAQSQVPIIMLTIQDEETVKVLALDHGADDYVTKPFGTHELLARVRVALRHRASATETREVQVGDLSIDFDRRRVELHGEIVRLTPIEYDLLRVLAQNLGRVVTHGQLLHQVWGEGTAEFDSHYVRIYIGHLRKKIESDPARPRLIVTEPGVGYRLVEPWNES